MRGPALVLAAALVGGLAIALRREPEPITAAS
jgi:hypothetical protein